MSLCAGFKGFYTYLSALHKLVKSGAMSKPGLRVHQPTSVRSYVVH